MISNLKELREYVTAVDQRPKTGSSLSLTVSHSKLTQKWIEIRFEPTETVADVKVRLYRHGGTVAACQQLQLLDANGAFLRELGPDHLTLAALGVQDGHEIRIVDLDKNSLANSGWLEDVSLVEKYVMPDDVYEAREGTVRKYKQQMARHKQEQHDEPLDESIQVGERCEVNPGARRGTVRFVGPVPALEGATWVGVELDEPMGRNDGSVKGVRLFHCAQSYGVVVKPHLVSVGDFPPRTLDEEDDSDDEI